MTVISRVFVDGKLEDETSTLIADDDDAQQDAAAAAVAFGQAPRFQGKDVVLEIEFPDIPEQDPERYTRIFIDKDGNVTPLLGHSPRVQ